MRLRKNIFMPTHYQYSNTTAGSDSASPVISAKSALKLNVGIAITPTSKSSTKNQRISPSIMHGPPSSPPLMLSTSMPERTTSKLKCTSISGMDIIQASPKSREMRKRRERYDPCCCPPSPTTTNLSSRVVAPNFDAAVLRSNRKRAHSEKGPWRSPSLRKTSHRSDDKNTTPQSHNRRRAHSTGPLVGTTVLVGGTGRILSQDSLNSESTDGSISSLEESLKGASQVPMPPKIRPMTAWPAGYPQAYPYHHQNPVQNGKQKSLSDMVIPELPKTDMALFTSRRKSKNSGQNLPDIESSAPSSNSLSQPPMTDVDSSFISTLKRKWTAKRSLVNLIFFLSLGIISFSTLNGPSEDIVKTKPLQPPVKKNLEEDIRTVKNFSGEWGLTLADAADEVKRDRNVRVRKKRQPRLAEANSLETQRLAFHVDSTSSNHFVLTDDEIKKKTSSRGEDNFGKHQHSGSALVVLAWVCLLVIGFNSVWGEMIRQFRMVKLRMRPSLSRGFNHSHSR